MLATIWIHLGANASKINDRLAVHFYSVAFLAFSTSFPLKALFFRSQNADSNFLRKCQWQVFRDVSDCP